VKDKKKEDYAFDRSKFDSDALSETDRRKNMLDAAEIIKAVARQSKPPERFITSVKQSIEKEVSKSNNPTEKGRLFLNWVLTKAFQATVDDAANGVLDGANDHGIDAILEVQGSEMSFFRIFQSKYGTSHSSDAVRAFKAKMDELLELKPNKLGEGRIRDALINIKTKGWDCEFVYVTDQNVDYVDTDNFHVYGFNQIVEKLWNEISEPAENKIEEIKLENGYVKYGNTVIGVISLNEIGRLVLRTKKFIFESNIRKFLPVKTRVNKQLRKSLLKEPEEVFYYNNGVTIVVKGFEELKDNKIRLIEPQIVNGAQTSTTIADVVRGDPNVQGNIQLTIITENVTTTRNNITRYRNSQNAVKGRDLISLERFHDSIYAQMKTKLGYFYEQQAGSWEAMNDTERDSYKGNEIFVQYLPDDHERRIPAHDAIQAMAAVIEQNPAKPYGSISKYMPGGAGYEKIFNEDGLRDDYRLLLYPYLVKSYSEKAFNYGSSKSNMPEKKYARLLFVTTYFKALHEHVIGSHVDFKDDPSVLDPYFEDFETNKKLLEITNEILEDFFDRTLYIRQDEDGRDKITLHNFFSHDVWSLDAQRILKGIMKRKETLQEIKKLFGKK